MTDQADQALARRQEAMAIYDDNHEAGAIGRSQRWLSRLSWVLGDNAGAERYAAAAARALEPLPPGRELAMAWSNLAQLRMLADDNAPAVRSASRALRLARELGDREAETHALNSLGVALWQSGELIEGSSRLRQSLDLALADDAHEHAARAYTNLGSMSVRYRSYAEADRQLAAGISYTADRDLDTWRLYMSAWLARSRAEQGRYDAARQQAAAVLRHPQLSGRAVLVAVPGRGAAAGFG
ncbi:MAG TPA: hypothetical protein VGG35_24375, partial [Streptosporangiaceae bacterium]